MADQNLTHSYVHLKSDSVKGAPTPFTHRRRYYSTIHDSAQLINARGGIVADQDFGLDVLSASGRSNQFSNFSAIDKFESAERKVSGDHSALEEYNLIARISQIWSNMHLVHSSIIKEQQSS